MSDQPSTLPPSIIKALPSSLEIATQIKSLQALINKLPKELEAAKRAGAVPMARSFVALHRLNDKMDELKKSFTATFEKTKKEIVPQCFEQEGLEFVPLSEGFRVGTSSTLYCSIKEGMKDKAYAWLKKNKLGALISETINASTLSAAARKMREDDNKELPADIFNAADVHNTSVTRTS